MNGFPLQLGANPLYHHVAGSPFQPGDLVKVICCCDEVGEEVGVDKLVGRFGLVKYLEYECGSGQHYPDDPMIGVRFQGGEVHELWNEELSKIARTV